MNLQLVSELSGRIWLMRRSFLEGLLPATRSNAIGRVQAAARDVTGRSGNIAVIQIRGVIDHHDSFFLRIFGGTSVDSIRASFRQAIGDDSISGVLLDFDTPGGVVDGVPELAAEIYKARGRKPIVAAVNTMAASAGYWLASQADEIVVSPSAETGSIGVYAEHDDLSKMLEQEGVKVTFISAGEGKVDGNPYEPLSDDARSDIQKRVDEIYGDFVAAVSRGREAKASTIRGDWKARIYGAKEAVKRGLADRVGTFEEAVVRAAGRKVGAARVQIVEPVTEADLPASEIVAVAPAFEHETATEASVPDQAAIDLDALDLAIAEADAL